MNRVSLYSVAVCLFVAALAVGVAHKPAATQPAPAKPIDYAPGKQIATLAHKAINESSGLAASRRRDGVFWTHNDSGDKPRLYALDRTGAHLGVYKIPGASHNDWEDIASFTVDDTAYLLIADTGDNSRRRKAYQLYLLVEPRPATATQPATGAKLVRTITFVYPDGANDAEGVAVDVPRREIYLVTRIRRPIAAVYRLPLGKLDPTAAAPAKPFVAEPVAALPVFMANSMDISPDGRRLVVGTYGNALQWTRGAKESWSDALRRPGRTIKLPSRRQGEGLCFGRDGRTIYLTSEKLPAPLIEIKPVDADSDGVAD